MTMKWKKARRIPVTEAELNLVEIKCAFCKGTGRDPFHLMSALSNCPVCKGKKTVKVREPYETCGACEGTGRYFNSKMYCWTCRGKGVIPIKQETQASAVPSGETPKAES